MKTPQFLNRAARVLAALALAFAIPACADEDNSGSPSSPGAGVNTPLQWTSTGNTGGTGDTSTTSANGDTPLLWEDPNDYPNYQPVGIGGAVRFTDVVTYSSPHNFAGFDVAFTDHPLRTQTYASGITIPEDNLAGAINTLRSTLYGGGGAVGANGGVVGGAAGVFIPMHTTGREANRAHAHHYSGYLPGSEFHFRNEEGDWLGTTNVADLQNTYYGVYYPALGPQAWDIIPGPVAVLAYPNGVPPRLGGDSGLVQTAAGGRMGKNGIAMGRRNPWSWTDHLFADPALSTYDLVFDECLNDPVVYYWMTYPPGLPASWTHMGVGFWIGGSKRYYWEISFLYNPRPAN